MSAPAAPTIPARKQAFLTAQTNLLSQPLVVSRNWRSANSESNTPLPPRLVDDALFNLNHAVQQHCRRVYAPQASRNVAEQISRSYTKDAERRAGDSVHGTVGRQADLVDEGVIELLPDEWPSEKQRNDNPDAAQQYIEITRTLRELSAQRKRVKRRLERLKNLEASLKPLDTSDGGVGVQENLVTRNGPVEKELERMKQLLARVNANVGNLQRYPARAMDLDAMDERKKVDAFLDNFPG